MDWDPYLNLSKGREEAVVERWKRRREEGVVYRGESLTFNQFELTFT